jgi:NadR type nicotinamide-nucleotide adenylyltransferase
MNTTVKKIAIVGPESTGKSEMAKALGDHFGTIYIPEFARYYCEGLNRLYTMEDEIAMFHGQLALENALLPFAKNNLVFCDTTVLTVKIWCDYLFGYTPELVLKKLPALQYDFYLLMDIDLPWQDDPLRDFPNQRPYFMQVWERELKELGVNYKVVSGLGEERLQNALKHLNNV